MKIFIIGIELKFVFCDAVFIGVLFDEGEKMLIMKLFDAERNDLVDGES